MKYFQTIYPSGYLDRLSQLIRQRLAPDANKAEIDARIWDLFGENWTVMFTDLCGFSRYVADFGIIHFLQIIYEAQRIFSPCIDRHDGILIKMEGDSMLLLFRQPLKAVRCAIEMQQIARDYNQDKIDAEQILLGVGIGYGKILTIGEQDIFGAEVNAASKLGEDTAKAGDILITDSVAIHLQNNSGIALEKIDAVPPGARGAFRVNYQSVIKDAGANDCFV